MGGLTGSWTQAHDHRLSRDAIEDAARWKLVKGEGSAWAYDPEWGQLPKRPCALHRCADRCYKKRGSEENA